MACCKDGFCQKGTRDRDVLRGQFRPPARPVPGGLVSSMGYWGQGEGGEVACSCPPPANRPSQGKPDPLVPAVRLGAGARLLCDGVDAESREAIGCKKSVYAGMRVRGMRLS